MSDYIPPELWPQILKKTTTETLLRCRCVCKSWKALISSPSFLSSQPPRIIARHSQQDYVLFNPQTLPSFDLISFQDHHPNPNPNLPIIGTAKGLICLSDDELTNTIVLWNPLIRKCFNLPTPIHSSPSGGYDSTLGIGFDPSTNDIKIVRIARVARVGGLFSRRRGHFPPNVEVFSVKEWKWRSIDHHDDLLDFYAFANRWSQSLVNGAAHWAGFLRSKRDVLMSFSFETEEFKIIELPLELRRAQVRVSKVGDSLCVLDYKHEYGARGAHACDVWAMKEYGEASSWCKMVSLRWEGGGLRCVMWVREDFGEMIVSTEDEEVLSCDPWNQNVNLIGFRCKGDGFFADGFVGSLGLLDA